MSLLAATTLGVDTAAATVHAEVRLDAADLASLNDDMSYRLVVQSYDSEGADGRSKPVGSVQRAVSKADLRAGVKVESSAGPRTPLEKRLETAAALYRGLEGALSLQGIPRPAALPPLRHAEQLRDGKHPLGDEVFALTNLYIETRFGGLELTTERARDFERRVREIKVTKAVKNAAVASASAT
jgi:hypothetical protein